MLNRPNKIYVGSVKLGNITGRFGNHIQQADLYRSDVQLIATVFVQIVSMQGMDHTLAIKMLWRKFDHIVVISGAATLNQIQVKLGLLLQRGRGYFHIGVTIHVTERHPGHIRFLIACIVIIFYRPNRKIKITNRGNYRAFVIG